MTTKTKGHTGVKPSSAIVQPEKLVALTLKIDSTTYQRLSALRAKERKTAQDILSEALMEHLAQAGA
jgi:hypothetical protein